MDTKTDRELIELAANAVGYKEFKYEDMRGWGEARYGLSEAIFISDIEDYWNPLLADGDAFRLAVDLNLFGTPDLNHYLLVLSFVRGYDKYTLMRRAIVMAAAKIGEGD